MARKQLRYASKEYSKIMFIPLGGFGKILECNVVAICRKVIKSLTSTDDDKKNTI